MQAAQMGVMALLGILVLLLVVRPLVRRIVTPEAVEQARGPARVAAPTVTIGADGKPLPAPTGGGMAIGSGPNISIVGGDQQVEISNRTSTMIEIAKVQGRVHAESVHKVGELAEKNPHEAVSIIRNWLHEDAA
jgi:flagellar M-ring protein FliF